MFHVEHGLVQQFVRDKLTVGVSPSNFRFRDHVMTREGFLRRLRAGKAVNCIYRLGQITRLISAWGALNRYWS